MTSTPCIDLNTVVGTALYSGGNTLGVVRVHDSGGLPIKSNHREKEHISRCGSLFRLGHPQTHRRLKGEASVA